MKKNPDFLFPAPENYVWPQCPEADQFIMARIGEFLAGHSFARRLSERMQKDTSTEFQAWVDHLILSAKEVTPDMLAAVGFIPDSAAAPAGGKIYWHPYADLPRILLTKSGPRGCAIMADSISDFMLANGLSLKVDGAPMGQYREARMNGEKAELRIIERRGTRSLIPDKKDRASKYLRAVELWVNRPRVFARAEDGVKHALGVAKAMVKLVGPGMAAWAFLEAERRYWHRRNRAALIQKARQDKLGLGWANHDHHTFRSSRSTFTGLMKIFLTFGFKKRERYYAGAEAGWGAQILEQPDARLVIFADVDLTPQEVVVDFSKDTLPDAPKLGTIGLWCALHGDSVLASGMHHLECKFDFEKLKESLKTVGVNVMNPFSDFPHLRQAFTEGELWPVPAARLDALRANGKISDEAYEKIWQNGAVGSHLENLQRRNGFKGFNQKGVSQIIREVNPELQAKRKSGEGA